MTKTAIKTISDYNISMSGFPQITKEENPTKI